MEFTAGQVLLILLAWVLGVFGLGRLISPKLVRALGETIRGIIGPVHLPKRLVPARCPVRHSLADQQPPPAPPDSRGSLRGWSSDDR